MLIQIGPHQGLPAVRAAVALEEGRVEDLGPLRGPVPDEDPHFIIRDRSESREVAEGEDQAHAFTIPHALIWAWVV
jgi:hypothetical protein